MTHDETLDAILHGYLYATKMKLSGDPMYKKIIFKTIARAVNKDLNDWELEFLKQRLFDDGFLKIATYGNEEPYELTPEGIKAAQNSIYTKNRLDAELDSKIKALTIKSLKDSRRALIISILAIIIPTLISLYPYIQDSESESQINSLETKVQQLQQEIKIMKMINLKQK